MTGTLSPRRVLVAMSGGVDSSAVCLMLRQAGYEPVGMTMRVYDLPRHFAAGGDTPDFIARAKALARRLGMEHHVVDVREEFRRQIVGYFTGEYLSGRTPNPCVRCNRDFKFRLMAREADRLGCGRMATGHYVRTLRHDDGNTYLLMGQDERKDQSYFLWRVPQATLRRCLFPLGGMRKSQVRDYLEAQGFAADARQGESMEVCFIEGDYRDFVRREAPTAPQCAEGRYVGRDGRTLGTHRGVAFYTVGQRKGLGIALGSPMHVVRLNAGRNTVVLGPAEALLTRRLLVEEAELVNPGEFFASRALTVRIRYHSRPVACRALRLADGRMLVETASEVSAVSPGQSAVFYIGRRLVGGAVIGSQKGLGALPPDLFDNPAANLSLPIQPL